MILSPIVDRVVTIAMKRAGFLIKRAADKTIVWPRDLVGSYLQIYFGDQELYGEIRPAASAASANSLA